MHETTKTQAGVPLPRPVPRPLGQVPRHGPAPHPRVSTAGGKRAERTRDGHRHLICLGLSGRLLTLSRTRGSYLPDVPLSIDGTHTSMMTGVHPSIHPHGTHASIDGTHTQGHVLGPNRGVGHEGQEPFSRAAHAAQRQRSVHVTSRQTVQAGMKRNPHPVVFLPCLPALGVFVGVHLMALLFNHSNETTKGTPTPFTPWGWRATRAS